MYEKYHLFCSRFEDKNISLGSLNSWPVLDSIDNPGEITVNLHGSSYSIPLHPITDYAREQLYHLLSFTYVEALSGFATRSMRLQHYQILYTLSGEGILEYENKTYHLRAGDGFFIDRSKLHSFYSASDRWENLQIHFDGSHSAHLFKLFAESDEYTFTVNDNSIFLRYFDRLLEISENSLLHREILLSNQIEAIALYTLCNSKSSQKAQNEIPENMQYLVRYMQRHYMDNLTLDFLSSFSNISKYHLCRIFKLSLGFSPNEYLIQLRIENAKTLLQNTSLSASKIGALVGIDDENYFYRIFKKKTGLSPNNYRNTLINPL